MLVLDSQVHDKYSMIYKRKQVDRIEKRGENASVRQSSFW